MSNFRRNERIDQNDRVNRIFNRLTLPYIKECAMGYYNLQPFNQFSEQIIVTINCIERLSDWPINHCFTITNNGIPSHDY